VSDDPIPASRRLALVSELWWIPRVLKSLSLLPLFVLALVHATAGAQEPIDVKELAEYRLTAPVFEQFQRASRLLAEAMRDDPRLAGAPLFTQEIAVSGDAPAAAGELETRLQEEPALAGALLAAQLSAREYTKFALALIAAHLARGFLDAGVLRSVPAGAAADNVAFVAAHRTEIAGVLEELGVDAEGRVK
jgi:hypothetical protein